jgi:small subunit ribosomal protein S16
MRLGPVGAGERTGECLVAVKLRLKKFGRRHSTCFRLSAMDCRSPRDGRVIEELGWYDRRVWLNRERIEYWLRNGAQPSQTVANLLKRQGIGLK